MRSDWLSAVNMRQILAVLMPPNRLVMQVALHTGLRVGDVVAMRTNKLAQRMTIKELKTGKSRRIYLPLELLQQLQRQAGQYWVFEHRLDINKHRTRQAVYKDVKAAAAIFKRSKQIDKRRQISPHSARKVRAVMEYKEHGLKGAQRLLNHSISDASVTMLYALADELTEKRKKRL